MAPADEDDKSWDSYRRLVVSEFERLNRALNDMNNKLDSLVNGRISKIEVDLGMLKVKVMLIGTGASIVMTTIITVILKIAKLG